MYIFKAEWKFDQHVNEKLPKSLGILVQKKFAILWEELVVVYQHNYFLGPKSTNLHLNGSSETNVD
jgi:hypothetical protein